MSRACPLSVRSQPAVLPEFDPQQTPTAQLVPLLQGEAQEAAWRLVDVGSFDGRPFQVQLTWEAGAGSGPTVDISVARATRVCIFARNVRVRATNLVNGATNKIWCTVADADGPVDTTNFLEVRGAAGDDVAVAIPTYAELARLDVEDPAAASNALLELVDGVGTVRAAVYADQQPSDGVPVGAAAAMRVTSAVPWRVVFSLHL